MAAKEAQARIKINQLLEEAGWRFFDGPGGKANIMLEANIFCRSQAAADGKIENILARMDDVQAKMAPLLHASFERFLAANVRAEHWEYAAAEDQVRDAFVQPYYLSPQDVAACLQHPAQAASDNQVAGRLHAALRTCLPDTEHLLSPV